MYGIMTLVFTVFVVVTILIYFFAIAGFIYFISAVYTAIINFIMTLLTYFLNPFLLISSTLG